MGGSEQPLSIFRLFSQLGAVGLFAYVALTLRRDQACISFSQTLAELRLRFLWGILGVLRIEWIA